MDNWRHNNSYIFLNQIQSALYNHRNHTMRQLTHYELTILIKNEISSMYSNVSGDFNIHHAMHRAKDILKYIEEYEQLEPIEE